MPRSKRAGLQLILLVGLAAGAEGFHGAFKAPLSSPLAKPTRDICGPRGVEGGLQLRKDPLGLAPQRRYEPRIEKGMQACQHRGLALRCLMGLDEFGSADEEEEDGVGPEYSNEMDVEAEVKEPDFRPSNAFDALNRAPGAMPLTLLAGSLLGCLIVTHISHQVSWDTTTPFTEMISITSSQFNDGYQQGVKTFAPVFDALCRNGPKSIVCFTTSDVMAQAMESRGKKESQFKINWARACKAAAIGCLINGVGFELWLNHLDNVFPTDGELSDPMTTSVELGAKTITDSFVYGTLSNSFNIFARRLLEGSSPDLAASYWGETILDVTFNEFKFWPIWNAFNFAVMPKQYQVAFAAFGALLFNVYISAVSNAVPEAIPVRDDADDHQS